MKECPVCGTSSNVTFIATYEDYTLLYCQSCCLRFSDPMNDPGRTYYETSDEYEGRESPPSVDTPFRDWRFFNCIEEANVGPGTKLLDVGCGDGAFLELASRRGAAVYGIDIDERGVRTARERRGIRNVICGGWKSVEEEDSWTGFDVVTSFDVLEHVSSPLDMVEHLSGLLKPGGTLVLTVPRFDRYPGFFDPVVDYPPHHFTLWTSRAIECLMEKACLEDVRIVEKPLLTEDVLVHFLWYLRRIRRKVALSSRGGIPGESRRLRNRLPVRVLTGIFDFLLNILPGTRGYTLMVVVKRPEK